MIHRAILTLVLLGAMCAGALAQAPGQREPDPSCPPEARQNVPRGDTNLSEKLAASKGVICPPAGVDPEMRQQPPAEGSIKIVPPPDTPGGNPRVQPK